MELAGTRSGAWRSRWAAVGAAVAVTLGAGGMVAVHAAPSDPSLVIPVEPTRILDTRTDVGLSGPFVSGGSQKLLVTGIVPTQPPGDAPAVNTEVVPAGATAVVLNATVVRPTTKGFLSIRPGDATGIPATSNINWAAGGPNIANSVIVQLPASGQIDIFVNGTVADVLIDVTGYTSDTRLDGLRAEIDAQQAQLDTKAEATETVTFSGRDLRGGGGLPDRNDQRLHRRCHRPAGNSSAADSRRCDDPRRHRHLPRRQRPGRLHSVLVQGHDRCDRQRILAAHHGHRW